MGGLTSSWLTFNVSLDFLSAHNGLSCKVFKICIDDPSFRDIVFGNLLVAQNKDVTSPKYAEQISSFIHISSYVVFFKLHLDSLFNQHMILQAQNPGGDNASSVTPSPGLPTTTSIPTNSTTPSGFPDEAKGKEIPIWTLYLIGVSSLVVGVGFILYMAWCLCCKAEELDTEEGQGSTSGSSQIASHQSVTTQASRGSSTVRTNPSYKAGFSRAITSRPISSHSISKLSRPPSGAKTIARTAVIVGSILKENASRKTMKARL